MGGEEEDIWLEIYRRVLLLLEPFLSAIQLWWAMLFLVMGTAVALHRTGAASVFLSLLPGDPVFGPVSLGDYFAVTGKCEAKKSSSEDPQEDSSDKAPEWFDIRGATRLPGC